MYSTLLIKIVLAWSTSMSGYPIDEVAYCNDLHALHELDLDAAIRDTDGLVDADGNSEVDWCF